MKRGVLLCGTGLGMSYAANRHPHVRAAVAWSPEIAELSRLHNDSNILVLPARFVSEEDANAILETWLKTPFEGGAARAPGREDRTVAGGEMTEWKSWDRCPPGPSLREADPRSRASSSRRSPASPTGWN